MNERIRELINEATSFKEGLIEGKHDIELFDKEKFAQLIVRECAEVGDSGDPLQDGGIARMIKKHFGVEQ